MTPDSVDTILEAEQLPGPDWRSVFVIAGEKNWGRQWLCQLLADQQQKAFWVSADPPEAVPSVLPEKFQHYLGSEVGILVFDAMQGLNVDSLAAMSGIVRGGGYFFLLVPALEGWGQASDAGFEFSAFTKTTARGSFFIQRFIRLLSAAPAVTTFEQKNFSFPEAVLAPRPLPMVAFRQVQEETVDQRSAIEAVLRVARGHRRRPLVLMADRGRGKTAALGRAAALLLREKPRRIVITAPNNAAIETAFWHAQQVLPDFELHALSLQQGSAGLFFVPPDVLLAEAGPVDLLLVDEAAAIPVPMLEALLRNHARVVFSSTVHGYEGTGRGFEIRFKAILNRLTPQWRQLFLKTPIRWGQNDPLEQFVFAILLLDAEPWQAEHLPLRVSENVKFEEWQAAQLQQNEVQLGELFGLLVQAHYRTRPSDLRMLLDVPSLRIFVLSWQGHLVAASVWMMEGGFTRQNALEVARSKRRPLGHLLPQTLAQHWGLAQAAQLSAARVVRIAVHPACLRQGLGRLLIHQSAERLRASVDYLGSSFGGTSELLSFWLSCGFEPLRLGFKREAASAEHALLVGRAVSEAGLTLIDTVKQIFQTQLPLQLSEFYHEVPVDLLLALLRPPMCFEHWPLSDYELAQVQAFADGQQSYEQCAGLLWKYAVNRLTQPTGWQACQPLEQQVLLKKLLQKKSWPQLKKERAFEQTKSAQLLLRQAIRALLAG